MNPEDVVEDDAAYEAPVRAPKSEKRLRGAIVSVRLTPAELETVQMNAEAAGMTMSAFLRSLGLNAGRSAQVATTVMSPRSFFAGAHMTPAGEWQSAMGSSEPNHMFINAVAV